MLAPPKSEFRVTDIERVQFDLVLVEGDFDDFVHCTTVTTLPADECTYKAGWALRCSRCRGIVYVCEPHKDEYDYRVSVLKQRSQCPECNQLHTHNDWMLL